MHDLTTWIMALGLPGIAIIIFIESGFPFGFFLPGDSLLFAAGLFAAKGHFPITLAMFIIFLANFAGVTIGYWSGKALGKRYMQREESIWFKREYVEAATKFYDKHGGKAIVLGRFVPAVRAFVPMIAGVAGMRYRRLMFYNMIGAVLWATSIPLLGYYAGGFLESRGINIDLLVLPVIALIVLISLLGPLFHALQNPVSRKQLLRKLKLRK